MRFRVVHRTHYRYGHPVSACYNVAHLRPRTFYRQTCISSELEVIPRPASANHWVDFFGNHASYFAVQQPHDEFTVTASSEVMVDPQPGLFDADASLPWEQACEYLAVSAEAETREAKQYALESPFVEYHQALVDYVRPSFGAGRPLLEAVHELMRRIHEEFAYDPNFSTVATPLSDVLAHRRGVCQDFAHLAIGCLRALGLAARYVSGYLETEPAPGQPRLTGADASHAWFSVFVPEQGWIDFDPTNNQIPMERHIVTAWGRDYADVTPLKGVIFGGGEKHSLEVAVDVQRLD